MMKALIQKDSFGSHKRLWLSGLDEDFDGWLTGCVAGGGVLLCTTTYIYPS